MPALSSACFKAYVGTNLIMPDLPHGLDVVAQKSKYFGKRQTVIRHWLSIAHALYAGIGSAAFL